MCVYNWTYPLYYQTDEDSTSAGVLTVVCGGGAGRNIGGGGGGGQFGSEILYLVKIAVSGGLGTSGCEADSEAAGTRNISLKFGCGLFGKKSVTNLVILMVEQIDCAYSVGWDDISTGKNSCFT